MIPGIEWGRPLGLVALILPVAVWLLALRRAAPAPAHTGALALWRRVAQSEPPRGERRKRRWTASLLLCIAALTLGALALGAPRRAKPGDELSWHLLVDRSPSMFLPRSGGSRYSFALDAACDWLDGKGVAHRRRAWAWWRGDTWVEASGARPPPAWGRAPEIPAPEPPFETRDEVQTLWISDRAPIEPPRRAGSCSSGGPAVPGPVSQAGASLFEWDGHGLSPGARDAEVSVGIDAALPEALGRLLRLWAESRALRALGADAPGARLRVTSSASAAAPVRVVAGRDGWRVAVDACASGARAFDEQGRRLEPWLSASVEGESARRTLVSFRPGRIDVALCSGTSSINTQAVDTADPAAFAVSWARLFDACLLPAPGVVSLAQRLDAGDALLQDPAPDAPGSSGAARVDESPAAVLAIAAAVASLFALALAGFSWARSPRRLRTDG